MVFDFWRRIFEEYSFGALRQVGQRKRLLERIFWRFYFHFHFLIKGLSHRMSSFFPVFAEMFCISVSFCSFYKTKVWFLSDADVTMDTELHRTPESTIWKVSSCRLTTPLFTGGEFSSRAHHWCRWAKFPIFEQLFESSTGAVEEPTIRWECSLTNTLLNRLNRAEMSGPLSTSTVFPC